MAIEKINAYVYVYSVLLWTRIVYATRIQNVDPFGNKLCKM